MSDEKYSVHEIVPEDGKPGRCIVLQDGSYTFAEFIGPDAKAAAEEYAGFKNERRKLPANPWFDHKFKPHALVPSRCDTCARLREDHSR